MRLGEWTHLTDIKMLQYIGFGYSVDIYRRKGEDGETFMNILGFSLEQREKSRFGSSSNTFHFKQFNLEVFIGPLRDLNLYKPRKQIYSKHLNASVWYRESSGNHPYIGKRCR